MKNELTRNELLNFVTEKDICALENENCEFTNRVTEGTSYHGFTEFNAYLETNDFLISVYYYQPSEDVIGCEDLSNLEFTPAFYTYESYN